MTKATPVSPAAAPEADEFWGLVIEPHARLFDFKVKEFWHYRDLICLFVRRDSVAQYAQTIRDPALSRR